MSKSIRYGILGCGMMGLEHLRNLALIDGAEVVAIAEPDTKMRTEALKLVPEAMLYTDVDGLLDHKGLDALVIVTPNYQHSEQLLEVLAKTILPVLIEKPIVTCLEDVSRIKAAADKHSAPVWVAMEYRYMPPIDQFRKRLKAGDVGELKMLSVREHRFPFLPKVGDWNRFSRNTGGTLVEKCCHFFDLMRLLTQDEAIRVYASMGQDNNHLDESYDGQTPDIIDNAYVIIDFKKGCRAMLDLNMFAEGSRYQEEVCAIGPKAKLECFVPGPGRFWPTDTMGPAPTPKLVLSGRNPVTRIESDIPVDDNILQAGDHNGSTFYQHQGFFNAVAIGAAVDVSVDDGLRAVVIGLAAQHSAKTGKAITITEHGFSFED